MSPKQIKRLRAKLQMTQPQFAEALGIKSREHVGQMKCGAKKPNATLILLMKTMTKQRNNIAPFSIERDQRSRYVDLIEANNNKRTT